MGFTCCTDLACRADCLCGTPLWLQASRVGAGTARTGGRAGELQSFFLVVQGLEQTWDDTSCSQTEIQGTI